MRQIVHIEGAKERLLFVFKVSDVIARLRLQAPWPATVYMRPLAPADPPVDGTIVSRNMCLL